MRTATNSRATVHAANECFKTAQLEEDKTLEWEVNWDWYTYRNALAGFMLMCFCTICLVNTTLTGMGSILQIKTCLLQKFNPCLQYNWSWFHENFCPANPPPPCYYFLTICHFSYKLEYTNYIIFAAIVIPIFDKIDSPNNPELKNIKMRCKAQVYNCFIFF